jgi:hypothetical protein
VDVVLPGPVATDIARNAFGMEGGGVLEGDGMKMSAPRFAALLLSSIRGPGWLMGETWISVQPALALAALAQYAPRLAEGLGKVVGPMRVEAFETGKDIYTIRTWVDGFLGRGAK